MASHNQSYRAGVTEGRTREKGEQMKESMKDKAEAAKQKTYEAAGQAKDKTYEAAGQAKDKTYEAAGQAKDKTYEAGQAVKDKTTTGSGHGRGQSGSTAARERAEEAKDRSGGILQQTGEKMKNMAQGAADAVKHTFGMADADELDDDPVLHHNQPPSTTTAQSHPTNTRKY